MVPKTIATCSIGMENIAAIASLLNVTRASKTMTKASKEAKKMDTLVEINKYRKVVSAKKHAQGSRMIRARDMGNIKQPNRPYFFLNNRSLYFAETCSVPYIVRRLCSRVPVV